MWLWISTAITNKTHNQRQEITIGYNFPPRQYIQYSIKGMGDSATDCYGSHPGRARTRGQASEVDFKRHYPKQKKLCRFHTKKVNNTRANFHTVSVYLLNAVLPRLIRNRPETDGSCFLVVRPTQTNIVALFLQQDKDGLRSPNIPCRKTRTD